MSNYATKNDLQETLKKVYPVGSIYMSVSSVNPATLFGFGTWVRWGNGRVPIGVNESDGMYNAPDKVGGTASNNYTAVSGGGGNTGSTALTINQMPAHDHKAAGIKWPQSGENYALFRVVDSGITSDWFAQSGTIAKTGGGQGHTHTLTAHTHAVNGISTIQPYITCYMWKRTA